LQAFYFNHLIKVLENETMDALRKSEFMVNEFAAFSTNTVKADHGRSWTGTYVFGKHTYIEFFAPNRQWKLNYYGVALGMEEEGGTDVAFQKLKKGFPGKVGRMTAKRLVNGALIPWYKAMGFKGPLSSSTPRVWTMEYLRSFMDSQKPPSLSEEDEISRERYLRPLFDPRRRLLDVVGATLALGAEKRNFLRFLGSLGYQIRTARVGGEAKGHGFTFTVVPKSSSMEGIIGVKMVLQNPLAKATKLRIGPSSILRINGRNAHWTF
jgi:hypothetical protein